jgi:hypothetical protein
LRISCPRYIVDFPMSAACFVSARLGAFREGARSRITKRFTNPTLSSP